LKGEEKADSDILIAGHVVIDEIIDATSQGVPRRALGGPPSYSSIALSSLGLKSKIVTKVGDDFPDQYSVLLRDFGGTEIEKFKVKGRKSTSFLIDRSVEPRRMTLLTKCKNLSESDFFRNQLITSKLRGLVVNTVAGEISLSLLDRISKEFKFVFVDSQGFVRKISKNNEITLRSGMDVSRLLGVDFLKADPNEISSWTGNKDLEVSLRQLERFVRYIIITSGSGFAEIYEGQKLKYRAKPLDVNILDTTGAGDIFLAVFASSFIQSENIPKALATSCCAASLALERRGIEKAVLDKQRIQSSLSAVEILRN
jgi:sugar/nucleoside kinase (ribokinase family)